MRVIAVDDERLALENIMDLLKELEPEAEVKGFMNSSKALEYLADNKADIALLDIEMGRINGIMFAKQCKELCPQINIIFVTGYIQYTMDALRLHASGYLMKPVKVKDLREELLNLRYPLDVEAVKRVRIQTFGNFEVFVDQKPLYFPMAKCKECLAYLVDRKGACITVPELAAVLWEDKPYTKTVQNNTHKVISDLMKTLKNVDASEIVIKTHREIGIIPEEVECDYYGFLVGNVRQINAFHGEYMKNYGWSEFTLAELDRTKNKYWADIE